MEALVGDEIVAATRDRLRQRGLPFRRVAVEGTSLVLGEGEERRSVVIGDLAESWNLLPPEDRARRLDTVIDMAGGARRAPARGSRERVVASWLVAVVLSLVAIASVTWASGEAARSDERRRARENPPAPEAESSAVAATRRQAICSGVRKRVVAGAPFGAYESEGWIVEIWLAREDGALGPGHAQLAPLAAGKLPSALEPELAQLAGEVAVLEADPPPGAAATARPGGALVQLRGGFAPAFVDAASRARFITLADRLYDTTSAQMGAMWARCGELPWHDLGTWFRGVDRGAAAGALLFMSGRYGDAGAVHGTSPSGASNTLGALVTRARQAVTADTLVMTVVDLGGRADTQPGVGTTITFPLAGYTLATRSSRELAMVLDRVAP